MKFSTDIQEVNSPAATALISICEKCGKKIHSDPNQNPSLQLQQSLKAEIKEKQLRGKVRAVSSSCLDICPEKKIAIGISYGNGARDRFFTVSPNSIVELKTEILRLSQEEIGPQ